MHACDNATWTRLRAQHSPQAIHIQLHEFAGAEQVLRLAGCCEKLAVLSPQLWLIRLQIVRWFKAEYFCHEQMHTRRLRCSVIQELPSPCAGQQLLIKMLTRSGSTIAARRAAKTAGPCCPAVRLPLDSSCRSRPAAFGNFRALPMCDVSLASAAVMGSPADRFDVMSTFHAHERHMHITHCNRPSAAFRRMHIPGGGGGGTTSS